jgi:hypothetical protein
VSDERLRELERQVAAGDPGARELYVGELLHRGLPIPLGVAWPMIEQPVPVWVVNTRGRSGELDSFAFLSEEGAEDWIGAGDDPFVEVDYNSPDRTVLRPNPDERWRQLQRRMAAGDADAWETYKRSAFHARPDGYTFLPDGGYLRQDHPEWDVAWGKLRDAFKLCFPAFETEVSGFQYMGTGLVTGQHDFRLRYGHMTPELRAECLRFLLMARRVQGYARRVPAPQDVSNLVARVRVSWTNKPSAVQVRFFTRGDQPQDEPSFAICWSGWEPQS